MKSMKRAKSFVASRSASNKYRPRVSDNDNFSQPAQFKARSQRSNSLTGRPVNEDSNVIEEVTEEDEELEYNDKGEINALASISGKSRLKVRSKVLVQLRSMKARVSSIDTMLHSLQDLSDRCQKQRIKVPRMRHCSDQDSGLCCEHDAIMKLVVDIGTHVKIVRNSLIFLCRSYLMEKQIAILVSVQEQMYPTFDISVRFFGIDWSHIFRVSYNLIHCVDLMTSSVVESASTALSDVLLPSNILRSLATIEADVSSHVEAVLHGRLSKITQEKLNLEQQQMATLSSDDSNDLVVSSLTEADASIAVTGSPTTTTAEATEQEEETNKKSLVHKKATKGRQVVEDLKRKLWKAFRLPTSVSAHSYLGRHTRSMDSGLIDKKARSHHDELWRAWYNGLQTIAIPAASFHSAQPLNLQAGASHNSEDNSVLVRSTTSDSFRSSSSSSAGAGIAASKSFQVSDNLVHHHCQNQQDTLEQSLTVHSEQGLETIDADVTDAQHPEEGGDDSFDSLTLTLTMATAPRQEVAENKL